MSIGRYAGDYMARVGSIPGGYVRKKDFSIDGKSWAYRDPSNFNDTGSGRSGEFWEKPDYNRHSYAYTNPLYDYSYGQVRDAAKLEGIKNVNSEEEVEKIIARIQGLNNPEPKEKKDKDKDKEPIEETLPVTAPLPEPPAPESEQESDQEPAPNPIQPLPTTPIGSIVGKLNPILNVSQANPVTVTGNKNKTNVDNSINQNTMDASDNRIFYGGSTRTFNNPSLNKAAAMVTNSFNQEGKDFMESSSNAQKLLANGFMDKFMRDRLFG